MQPISLRSDTETLPTQKMLDAILSARLGDDVLDEDPTVKELERKAADVTNMPAAMLCISGTMANLLSLMTLGKPGDEVIIDPESHIYYYEVGGLASVAGLMPKAVKSHDGMLEPNEVKAAIRDKNIHYPTPRLLCLENTHNRSGGRVVPLKLHNELCDIAREKGLKVHLDGARIFNATVASGTDIKEYTANVDSIMFSLSKALSCPLGSMLCGSEEFISAARRNRKRIGGGMRQAGIIAAAGIVALDSMIDRLAEDHSLARYLAEQINENVPNLSVDVDSVETNMVVVDHSASGLSNMEVVGRFRDNGVLVNGLPPNRIRLVVTRHHNREIVDEIVKRLAKAMQ